MADRGTADGPTALPSDNMTAEPSPFVEQPTAESTREVTNAFVKVKMEDRDSQPVAHANLQHSKPYQKQARLEVSDELQEATAEELCYPEHAKKYVRQLESLLDGDTYIPNQAEPAGIVICDAQAFKDCQNECHRIVSEIRAALAPLANQGWLLTLLDDCMGNSAGELLIGLHGASGAGKSSLINSLCSIPGLALTDCGTTACTNFPVEYAAKSASQLKLIEARISICSENERHGLIQDYLQKYRDEMFRVEEEEEMDDDDDDAAEMNCQEAADFFSSLFRDKRHFQTATRRRAYLCQDEKESILLEMEDWISALLENLGITDNEIVLQADSPSELEAEMAKFVNGSDFPANSLTEAAIWPIIRRIRVHVDALVLNSGIVLVDLPGVNDVNRFRVRVAQKALLACQHVLVVLLGKRVQSDTATRDYIDQVNRRKGSKMSIVLTHADSIYNSRNHQEDFNNNKYLQEVEDSIADLKSEISLLKKTPKRLRPPKQEDKIHQMDDLQKLLRAIATGFKIDIARTPIVQQMQDMYAEFRQNHSNLHEVHLVSNCLYMQHINSLDDDGSIPIPVDFTGIPSLRRKIRKLGELPQADSFKNHLENTIPNAFTNAIMWCEPMTVDISAVVKPSLGTAMEACREAIENMIQAMSGAVQHKILDFVTADLDGWKKKSLILLAPYIEPSYNNRKLKIRAFASAITNNGKHMGGPDLPPANWNKLILEPRAEGITAGFGLCKQRNLKALKDGRQDLLKACDTLLNSVENSTANLVTAKMDILSQKTQHAKIQIGQAFKTIENRHAAWHRTAKTYATMTDEDCAIMSATNPIYENIKERHPKGKGFSWARHSAFYGTVQEDTIYDDYNNKVTKHCLETLDEFLQKQLREKIQPIFDELKQAILEFGTLPKISDAELAERAAVGKRVKEALELIRGPLMDKFRSSLNTDRHGAGTKHGRS